MSTTTGTTNGTTHDTRHGLPPAAVAALRVIEQLGACEWGEATVAQLMHLNRGISRARAFLDSCEARGAQRQAELHAEGKAASVDDELKRSGRQTQREARRAAKRAATLRNAPAMAGKLEDGKVTGAHADALANVAGRLDDDTRDALFDHDGELADAAASMPPDQFARHCKAVADQLSADDGANQQQRQLNATRLTKHIDEASGMYIIRAEFDPETGARIFTALDAEIAALAAAGTKLAGVEGTPMIEQLAAHAFGNLVLGGHRATRPGVAEVVVHIDYETLVGGLHDHGVCELSDGTTIPVGMARRLACDARILPVVLGGDSVPLDLGRDERLANRAQRRALRAIYPTCGWKDCGVGFNHCEVHHLQEWDDFGPTDLANLLPLCSRHHHHAHELKWQLSLDSRRTLTIVRPDGALHAVARPPGRQSRAAA